MEEALRGFPGLPGHCGSGASSRCVGPQTYGAIDGETNAVPSRVTRNWAQVVRGAKAVRQHQESVVPVENRFRELEEVMLDGDSEGETRGEERTGGRGKMRSVILVGDSNVKRLEAAIGKDAGVKESVTFAPFSGAGIGAIRDRIGAVVSSAPAGEVSVVLHVGTNDTPRTGSELIIAKLRQLIRACRDARSGVKVSVCAIPSRTDKGGMTWSRSEGVNDRLTVVCAAEGAKFLDTRKALRRCESPMARDGVHFSGEGAKAVGTAIVKETKSFLG